jgi:hypothetical protein
MGVDLVAQAMSHLDGRGAVKSSVHLNLHLEGDRSD